MQAPPHVDDASYERPIRSRYLDALELVWLATAKRLGFVVRRHPDVFSMSEGDGIIWLSVREHLDPDDTPAQMLLHEICHWITNGEHTRHTRDWDFEVDGPPDPREHAGLRLQASLADSVGLRHMLGPTGYFRQYYDAIQAPLSPLDDSPWEAEVVRIAAEAIARAAAPPFAPHLQQALQATRTLRDTLLPFQEAYQTELPEDALPSWWLSDAP